MLSCSSCNLHEECFLSLRVAGDTGIKIMPFKVNLCVIKAIYSFGKGAMALFNFFTTMKIFHCGLQHKTYQGHMKMMLEACSATATKCEAANVARIRV